MEQLANSPSSTLVGSIGSTATTITVLSAATFPPTGNFTVKIDNELLKVTGVAGTVFTVVRGEEGTAGVNHSSGVQVKQVITANVLNNLFAEFNKTGPWASRPTSDLVRAGTTYQATDIDLAWLYNGTDWDLIHPLHVPYAKRVDVSGWTALNLGTNVWTDYNGVASVAQAHIHGVCGYYHTLPTPPYTVTMIVGPSMLTAEQHFDGIILYDSASTKVKFWARASMSGDYRMKIQNWNNPTSYNAAIDDSRQVGQVAFLYIRFQDDNTNWKYWVSHNNQDWHLIRTEVKNSFLTPTHIGMATYRSVPAATSFMWYSRYFGYWEQ